MENPPDAPDGYKQPQPYELRKWQLVLTGVILAVLFLALTESIGVQYRIPDDPVSNIAVLIFASAGTVYIHESTHYVVVDFLDWEPEFVWPFRVDWGVDVLPTRPTVTALLAPQMFSVLYIGFIMIGVAPELEVLLVWALVLNLVPGAYDIVWAVRRLTWPNGTIVILQNQNNYVAHPEE